MMTQTLAIFADAYRELQAKKMFWIVLILNLLVVLLFSLLGASSRSLTVLWYELGDMRGAGVSPLFLYKYAFSNVIVGLWLTWLSTVLALISTAGIFPDFLSSGSIDLYLAKPIGRLRLFFTKYAAGLIFVSLQVALLTLLSFFVLGIRAGIWEPGLFWAIPIVLIFFSYLFAICTLLGVWTRSTIAALLLTLLAWFLFWGVDKIDRTVIEFGQQIQMQHERLTDRIDALDRQIAALPDTLPATGTAPALGNADERTRLTTLRADLVAQQNATITPSTLITAQRVLFGIKSVVPKTRDTIVLLDRFLFKDQELKDLSKLDTPPPPEQRIALPPPPRRGMRGAASQGPNAGYFLSSQIELDRQRSAWWIIGTSLLFELVCLALAAWHFCTRDF